MRPVDLGGFVGAAKYKLYGLVFLLIIAMFCALTVGFYLKAFRDIVPVVLKVERAGLQMSQHADVKIRGVIVGEVTQISSSDRVATLQLALQPEDVGLIPANVKARLLPKTLFGQKYVSLVVPDGTASSEVSHIQAGAVIPEDRSKVAIELNRVFNSVLPLLRSIDPAKLNTTLNALATALSGRGEQIGQNLVQLQQYLKKLEPSLPALKKDISLLADFAETYADAAPDLLRVLDNLTFTSNTVLEERKTLRSFLGELTTFARTGREVLAENKQALIKVNAVNRPTLDLLARYSPEFPCFLEGLAGLRPRLSEALGGDQPGLHITLELVKPRPAYDYPEDLPEYEENRGPYCYGLPDNPLKPFPDGSLRDGAETLPEKSTGTVGAGAGASKGRSPGASTAGSTAGTTASTHGRALSGVLSGVSMGYAGTAAEQRIINHLVGPALGKPPRKVSDVATLLFGPMARGTVVRPTVETSRGG